MRRAIVWGRHRLSPNNWIPNLLRVKSSMKRRISGDSENNWDAPSSQTDHFHQHIKVLNTQFFGGFWVWNVCGERPYFFLQNLYQSHMWYFLRISWRNLHFLSWFLEMIFAAIWSVFDTCEAGHGQIRRRINITPPPPVINITQCPHITMLPSS